MSAQQVEADQKYPQELLPKLEQYRQHGHLLKASTKAKTWECDFWRYWFCIVFHWSRQGPWETFKATGSVYVNYFAVQRIVMLSKDGDKPPLSGWQLLAGPLMLNFGAMRIK